MSDGHTDASRYSRFYEGLKKEQSENIDMRLNEAAVILEDDTEVALDRVMIRLDGKTTDLMSVLKRMLILKENRYRSF